IEIENLSYAYSGNRTALSNVTLTIKDGEFWGVLGHNGSGKTTLLDLVLGFKTPTKGRIKVLGQNPSLSSNPNTNELSYLSQDIRLKGDLLVSEFLYFHSIFYSAYSKEIELSLLDYFQVSPNSQIGALSTG